MRRVSFLPVLALCGVGALGGAACLGEPTPFGKPCTGAEQCGALVCVDERCVPPRGDAFAGNSCDEPLLLQREGSLPDDHPQIGTLVTPWGETGEPVALPESCIPPPLRDRRGDVVFEIPLDEPTAIRATARMIDRPDATVALALVPLDDGACGSPIVDGCAWQPRGEAANDVELLVPRLDGDLRRWGLVVSSEEGVPGALEVVIEHLDCPVGSLPLDESTCGGFRAVEPLQIPRIAGELVPLGDGRAAYIGGFDEQRGEWRPDVEVFDPSNPGAAGAFSDGWSFDGLRTTPPPRFGAAQLDDNAVIVLGSDADGGADGEVFVPRRTEELLVEAALSITVTNIPEPDSGDLRLTRTPGGIYVAGDGLAMFLQVSEPPARCRFGVCPTGRSCVTAGNEELCLCSADPCPPSGLYSVDAPFSEPRATSFSTPATREAVVDAGIDLAAAVLVNREGLVVHEEDFGGERVIPQQPMRPGSNVVGPTPRDLAAVTTVSGSQVLVSGGQAGTPAAPTDRVELVDALARPALVGVAALPSPRVAPTSTHVSGGTLVAGGCGAAVTDTGAHPPPPCPRALDDAVWIADAPDSDGRLAVVRLPRLPAPLANHAALALDDARVLLTGGPLGETFVFERVQRRRAPPPPPIEPKCGLVEEVALDESGVFEVEGDTNGASDQLRAAICDGTTGPETRYRLVTTTPAHLSARVTAFDGDVLVALWLYEGSCGDVHTTACGTPDLLAPDESAALEVLSLPAGEHFLVVEANRGIGGRFAGGRFALEVELVPQEGDCPVDGGDPADDVPEGARPFELVEDSDDDAPVFGLDGVLCGADRDHVLVEHPGGAFEPILSGAPRERARIMPADVDVPASIAADAYVFSARAADAVPLAEQVALARGIYVIALEGFGESSSVTTWVLANYPDCALDDGDSVVVGLDDEDRPERRTVAGPAERVRRTFCWPEDVDVVEVALPPGGDMAILLGTAFPAEVWAIDDDGALLSPVPSSSADGGTTLRVLEADRPARAAVVLGPAPPSESSVTIDPRVFLSIGDTCDAPLALAPDSGAAEIDLRMAQDDVDASAVGDCTGYDAPGGDVIYRVDLGPGDTLTVDAVPLDAGNDGDGADVALYLVDGCPPGGSSCVAGIDEGYTLDPERLVFTNPGPAGTFYLIVDSYYVIGFPVALEWSIDRP